MLCMTHAGLTLLALLPWAAMAGTIVPGERVLAVAQQQLQAHSASIDARWEFIPAGTVADSVMAQAGDPALQAGRIDGRWPRNRVGVPVQITVDGTTVQTRTLWFTVHAWRDTRVYAQDQRAGDASEIVQSLVRLVDLAAHDALNALPEQASLAPGLRLRRGVRAGQPMREDDFAPMPAVARHTQVSLRLQRGTVALNTTAAARTDAAVGEHVDVLPSGATQWIKATVTGPNEVVIEN